MVCYIHLVEVLSQALFWMWLCSLISPVISAHSMLPLLLGPAKQWHGSGGWISSSQTIWQSLNYGYGPCWVFFCCPCKNVKITDTGWSDVVVTQMNFSCLHAVHIQPQQWAHCMQKEVNFIHRVYLSVLVCWRQKGRMYLKDHSLIYGAL